MEELDHFCHSEHVLSLSKEAAGFDESGNAIVCCGCNSPIDDHVNSSSSTFYQCAPCHVYIHKLCAETLDHRSHPEHPLSLSKLEARLDESGNGVVCYNCDTPISVDDRFNSTTFYECATCQFYLHRDCAETLDHSSHSEHLLCLAKEARLDESGNGVVCYGCNTPIGDVNPSTFYECTGCQVYLHKRCAEAPTEIIYSKHSKHPLNLLRRQPYINYTSCECTVCHRDDWKWFTYHCYECPFDIDIICAFKDMDIIRDVNEEDRSLQHDGHQHSLTLQQRQVLLHCDACQTESKDYSYSCNTCNFWIHKKCALLPKTMDLLSHEEHSLDLAYSFPESHLDYPYNCDICSKLLGHTDWIYYCGLCRYFVHLNCAITSNATPDPEMQSDREDYENLEKFPINEDRSANLIREFVEKMSLEEEKEIDHWYHADHPLILWDNDQSNKSDIVYEGMHCAACMLPITSPFYHCSECSYFIHRYCALLPLELPRHEAHDLDHPLQLFDGSSTLVLNFFWCTLCGKFSSGFFYYCSICEIKIDIRCISLPTKILHNSHRHPLITASHSDYECKACGGKLSGSVSYQCETCTYAIHYACGTRYPHTLTHDYDEHPIYLAYPPIENPSYFCCEICEKNIHPKYWMYCCKLCRFYFHVDCLHDPYLNVKFGSTHKVYDHPHLLTFVPSGGNSSPLLCEDCGDDEKSRPVLKCKECGFTLCIICGVNRIKSRPDEER